MDFGLTDIDLPVMKTFIKNLTIPLGYRKRGTGGKYDSYCLKSHVCRKLKT
jgi:hypothetical protein